MATDARHLGKTLLQIERERMIAKIESGWPESTPLSSDECAIAVNDPNGCASWLRALADSIERGDMWAYITFASTCMTSSRKWTFYNPVKNRFKKVFKTGCNPCSYRLYLIHRASKHKQGKQNAYHRTSQQKQRFMDQR